jgi:hypothetical protein
MEVFNSNYKQNLMKKKFWDEYEKKYISLFEYKMQYENQKLDILYDNIYYSNDCVIWHDDEINDIDDYNKTDQQWIEETEKIEQDLKKDYLEQLEEEQEYDELVFGKY